MISEIAVFVAIEATLFADAIMLNLLAHPGYRVAGEATSATDLMGKLNVATPDVIVMDSVLSGVEGISICEALVGGRQERNIVLLADLAIDSVQLDYLYSLGVRSVVSKNSNFSELKTAINFASVKRAYWASAKPELAPRQLSLNARFSTLSVQEHRVAIGLGRYCDTRQLADELGVSVKTVHTYKERVLIKMELHSVNELILFLIRHGDVCSEPSLSGVL